LASRMCAARGATSASSTCPTCVSPSLARALSPCLERARCSLTLSRAADPEPGEDRPAAHARRRGVPGPRCVGAAFSFQPTRGARRLGRAVHDGLLVLTHTYPPAAVAFENPENYNHRASASSRCRLSTRSDPRSPSSRSRSQRQNATPSASTTPPGASHLLLLAPRACCTTLTRPPSGSRARRVNQFECVLSPLSLPCPSLARLTPPSPPRAATLKATAPPTSTRPAPRSTPRRRRSRAGSRPSSARRARAARSRASRARSRT